MVSHHRSSLKPGRRPLPILVTCLLALLVAMAGLLVAAPLASAVATAPTFLLKWGTYGNGDSQFYYPTDVAVDVSGNVYVADTYNNRIQVFDSTGGFITKLGSSGSGNGQLYYPMGVAVDGSGNVYVADTYNHRIQVFDSGGSFITKWGSLGAGNGQFSRPVGVAVDGAGNIYVADLGNHRIQKFGPAQPSDETPPEISVDVSGTLGDNGWYTSDVTVTWTVIDEESEATTTGCEAQNVTSDTAGVTYTCSAESDGGSASESVTIKRDATAPTISGAASPGANASGWNNTDVTVIASGTDTGSGIASCTTVTLTAEGSGQSATVSCTDNAGNSASVTVGNINLDKTAPSIAGSRSPAANANGWNNTDVTVTFEASDTLSGLDTIPPDRK